MAKTMTEGLSRVHDDELPVLLCHRVRPLALHKMKENSDRCDFLASRNQNRVVRSICDIIYYYELLGGNSAFSKWENRSCTY